MSRLINHDRKLLKTHRWLVGVDEAGRGCLAGPVVAAAVAIDLDCLASKFRRRHGAKVRDSKLLKPELRRILFEAINGEHRECRLFFSVGVADVQVIERHNILGATRLAMQTALESLEHRCGGRFALRRCDADALGLFPPEGEGETTLLLVDGKPLKPFPYAHQALVQGDDRSFSIALASICAKVYRDNLMADLDKVHPGYDLASNKGYGTPRHREALLERGPCGIHRSVFLRKILGQNEGEPGEQTEIFSAAS